MLHLYFFISERLINRPQAQISVTMPKGKGRGKRSSSFDASEVAANGNHVVNGVGDLSNGVGGKKSRMGNGEVKISNGSNG